MRLQCSVPDCCKPVHGQRLCPMHYARWRRIGSTNLRSRIDRFLTKVRFTDSCWLWQGGHTAEGYGYEFCIGALPASLEIDQQSTVRICDALSCIVRRLARARGSSAPPSPGREHRQDRIVIRWH